jgi:hypothetical protein
MSEITVREVQRPQLSKRISLPGGQNRLRQLILYVAQRCASAPYFGSTKLNKILWKADFDSFAMRGVPVTGREYQRLDTGPAPKEMRSLHREMLAQNLIKIEIRCFSNEIEEHRTVAIAAPDLSIFTEEDRKFVDDAIAYYWHKTGREASDDAHGVAWKTHKTGDSLPYELARLADKPLSKRMMDQLLGRARKHRWITS